MSWKDLSYFDKVKLAREIGLDVGKSPKGEKLDSALTDHYVAIAAEGVKTPETVQPDPTPPPTPKSALETLTGPNTAEVTMATRYRARGVSIACTDCGHTHVRGQFEECQGCGENLPPLDDQ